MSKKDSELNEDKKRSEAWNTWARENEKMKKHNEETIKRHRKPCLENVLDAEILG